MNPKKIWANFSVKDAARTNEFYTRLGLKANQPNKVSKLASFLFGEDDFVIHFFEKNTQIDEYLTSDSESNTEIMFTLSAETEEEVKEWESKVREAGGSILIPVGRDKAGYFGFAFSDPDGHKFNVLLMEAGM